MEGAWGGGGGGVTADMGGYIDQKKKLVDTSVDFVLVFWLRLWVDSILDNCRCSCLPVSLK